MENTTRTCPLSGREFIITPLEKRILSSLSLPLPTICPAERHRRRLAHRNEDSLYLRNCDLSGERMISIYPPDSAYTVYSQTAWWGDAWHGGDYGVEFDFRRPFFEQFAELQQKAPRIGLMNSRGENSEYCHNCLELKNCYLVFGGDYVQDSMYSYYNDDSSDVVDVYRVKKSELVYDSIDSVGCYNVKYCEQASNCRDSLFLLDCQSCADCCGCVGLVQARFCFFNEQLTEEAYRARLRAARFDTWTGVERFKEQFRDFAIGFPRRAAWLVQTENCTGNRLTQAKGCIDCFDLSGPVEDLVNVYSSGSGVRDVASSNNLGKVELCYEVMSAMEGARCALSLYAWSSSEVLYSDTVLNCRDVFGCASLRSASNAILNRSYTAHEYQTHRAKIISHMKETGEWGEFFPIAQSPFAYNETLAYTFFPLTREAALNKNWRWAEREPTAMGTGSQLPDSIAEVGDDIVGKELVCEATGKLYKVIKPELDFYRKMDIPLPRRCFAVRTSRKHVTRGGLELHVRACSVCGVDVSTPYSEQQSLNVICERCVQKRY